MFAYLPVVFRIVCLGCLSLIGFAGAGCASSAPVVVHPTLPAMPRCDRLQHSWSVGPVRDRRGYAQPNNVGFTQRGIYNVKAPLHTSPPPHTLVEGSLRKALAKCSTEGATKLTIEADLIQFHTDEVSGWTSEEIHTRVKLRVRVLGSGGASLRAFDVKGEAKRTATDTTSLASAVIGDALRSVSAEFLRKLTKLDGSLKDVPATDGDARRAWKPAGTWIGASTHRLDRAQQTKLLGAEVPEHDLLVFELLLRLRTKSGPSTHVHRHGVSLLFSNGRRVYALDASKVQEHVRVNAAANAGGLGLIGGASAMGRNEDNRSRVARALVSKVVLVPMHPEVRMLLVFNPDLDGAAPRELEVGLTDPRTGAVENVRVHIVPAGR